MASFGSGVSVGGGQEGGFGPVVVSSPTTATAQVTVSPNASTGSRVVTIRTGAQTASLSQGFSVGPPPNAAPHITSTPVTAATATVAYTYTATATDADNDTLQWTLSQAPAEMLIGATTGVITWTPPRGVASPQHVVVQVSDGRGGTDTQAFDVLIDVPNAAPIVQIGAVGPVTLPATAAIAATVTDDGKVQVTPALSWSLVSGPDGGAATFVPQNTANTTVTFTAPGSYRLRLSAYDGELTGTAEVIVTVIPKNDPPVVAASGPAPIELPAVAALHATATDDGQRQVMTYLWAKFSGPGTVAFSAPTALDTTATFGAPGTYVLRFTADDGEFKPYADVTVTANAPASDNQPPRVNAGPDLTITLPADATLAGTATDDGKPVGSTLDVSWSKWSGPGAVTFADPKSPSTTASFSAAGVYVLHLTATDGQLPTTDDVVVTVNGGATTGDRSPPVVTLHVTTTALPGAQVDVRAQGADNDRVSSMRLEVEGQAPVEAQAATISTVLAVPAVATPGQAFKVAAIARDPAGNEGRAEATVTVTAIPDTTPPEIQLRGPATAAPGQTVQLVALATDAGGVASVAFLAGDTQIGQGADAPYTASYAIPADAAVGSSVGILARATDVSGNVAESTMGITVVADKDTTPPTVTLTATGTLLPGSGVSLTADAADASGIAGVRFTVDGVSVAAQNDAPYGTVYTIPASVAPGTRLNVVALATDFAGQTASDAKPLVVAMPAQAIEALVVGEVYDDSTGLPLAGASVRLHGTAAGAASPTAATDSRGRYSLRGVAGDGVVRVQKDAWTSADRPVSLVSGHGIEVFDARLTPMSDSPVSVSPVLGGEVGTARARLMVPSGALAEATPLRVTGVGQQGLQGLLPYGWSPVGAADVAPHATAFVAMASLTAANSFSLPAGTALVVARWDEEAVSWRKVADTTVRADGQVLEAGITGGGQYAWLLPDVPPPAPLAVGDPIPGVAASILPDTVTTAITPQPKVAFYKPGVRADVRGLITTTAPVSSGVRLWQRLVESYRYYSGAEVHPEPFVQDLVFYRVPLSETSLAGSAVVTPSLTFEPLTLERGVIAVELFVPSDVQPAAVVVGSTGATVQGPAGESLVIEPGSLADPTAIRLATLSADQLGITLPPGLAFSGGVVVTMAGELLRGAALSVPKPAGATAGDQFLVVRLAELGGRTRLVLVAIGRAEGDRLVSETRIGGESTSLEGVRMPGRYLFVKPASPLGFAAGVVRAVSGGQAQPFGGAIVSVEAFEIVSISAAGGGYFEAAPAGAATLTALDAAKGDTGRAATFLTAGSVLAVPLLIEPQMPRVVTVSPADGATNVALTDPIVVTFSKAIDAATVTGANAANVLLTGPGGAPVDATSALSIGNTVLTLRPASALAANTRYTITVNAAVKDVAGYNLASTFTASFDSLDTTPPRVPPAGAITASVPGIDGQATISATQGTVSRTDTVYVVNLTDRTTRLLPQALYQADGSFRFQVPATITDKLQLRIVDRAGNETLVALDRFQQTNADGSVSAAVDSKGGDVDSPGLPADAVRVDVREDAFPDGAVVTVKKLLAADIPIQLSTEDQERFAIRGGIQVDFGGALPARYVNLSMPAAPSDTASDVWLVGRLVTVDGQQTLAIVDTAKLIDGRITTSSPPFTGVTNSGTYVVVDSKGPMGVGHAYVTPAEGSKVNLHFALATMNPSMLNLLSQMPYMVEPDGPRTMGFPMPAGRVTLSENSVRLRLEPTVLAPVFREFHVRNMETGRVQRYPLVPIDYRVVVDGAVGDGFDVTVDGPFGKRSVASARLTAGQPGRVTVRLNPDKIPVPVTTVSVKNLATSAVSTFSFPLPDVRVGVAGDRATSRDVWLVDVNGERQSLAASEWEVLESPFGAGNLVLRGMDGALGGRGTVASMRLLGKKGSEVVVPPPGWAEMPDGTPVTASFAFAFNGDATDDYILRIDYSGLPSHYIPIPRFQVTVKNTTSGEVAQTISRFVPPPDEPLDLGTITDDAAAPYVVSGPERTGSFDPTGSLTVTFSEPMNAESLKQFIVLVDGQGRRVAGSVHVSGGNRVATFVPNSPLRMGEQYTLTIQGGDPVSPEELAQGVTVYAVRDGAGNPVATMNLKVTTFTPRVIASLAGSSPFKDVAIRRKTIQDRLTTTLFVTAGGQVDNLVAIDVTNPTQPQVVGKASAAQSQQRITLLPDVTMARRDGATFAGDLAVTTQFGVNFSSMVFFDVSSRAAPGILSSKVLTVNPDLMAGPNSGNTMFAYGYAKGVAAFQTTGGGVVSYAAVEGVGVMATDVGQNVPQRPASEGLREPVFSGYFTDVTTHQGNLVAVTAQSGLNFYVLDPNLALVGSTGLSYKPRRVRVVTGLQADVNGDGVIGSDEVFTLAVVGGDFGISIVDLRNASAPEEIGRIPLTGTVRDIEIDPGTRRIMAAADLSGGGPTLMAIDLSHPGQTTSTDADQDGFDDRILWRQSYASGVNGMRLDRDRGLLYVANPGGLDVWGVYDSCCDLGVDMRAPIFTEPGGKAEGLYKRELAAIKKGIIAGLDRAAEKCAGFQVSSVKMLESGSSACLWSAEPEKTCGSNYQPGVSDHDISVFMPDQWYSIRVPNPSKTADPHDGRDATVLLTSCVVDSLSYQFTDFDDPDRRPRDMDGFKFKDITFLPNYFVDFQAARYRLERTNPGEGDADNDLGLGRQLLVMKHLTEAYGVRLGPGDPGFREGSGYEQVGWTDAEFNAAFKKYREVTKIGLVEGYEWANLMEFLFVKGKGLVRVAGAEDETSAFHDLYVYQLHAAGKAGIRTALARMAASPAARGNLVLRIKRDATDPDPGLFTLRGEKANACLVYERDVKGDLKDPATFAKTRACGSMEDFAASTAVRTLTFLEAADRPFTPAEVKQIVRFYLVKSDEEQIATAAKADQFINDVYRFIQDSKAVTHDYWNRYVNGAEPVIPRETLDQTPDPDGTDRIARRIANMARKDERLGQVGKVKLHVIPHVYNQSYRDVGPVTLSMYVRPPGASAATPYCADDEHGQPACGTKVFLEGGDHQYPGSLTRDDGSFQRETATGHEIPAFLLKVDQAQTAAGQVGSAAFTIDLPDRTVKESNRRNNVGGFFYYLLDTSKPTVTVPTIPSEVPVPISGTDLLTPDLECTAAPELVIDQRMVVGGADRGSPAALYIGEQAELYLSVRNISAVPATGVTVCTTLTNACYFLGTVVASASAATVVPFSSLTPFVAQSIPTAFSNETGIQTGSPFDVTVAWTGFQLVKLEPDPNPTQSEVMIGGTSFRHFGVISTERGTPIRGGSVTVNVTGPVTATRTFTTNKDGIVGTFDDKGKFDPGVAIEIPPTAALQPGGADTFATVKFASINGMQFDPATAPGYTIKVTPFLYQELLRTGMAAAFSGKLLGGQVGLGGGVSYGVTFDQRSEQPRADGPYTTDLFTVGRQTALLAEFGFSPELGASAEVPIVGKISAKGPSAEVKVGATIDYKDGYQFKYPIGAEDQQRLIALTLNTAIGAVPAVGWVPNAIRLAKLSHIDAVRNWLDQPPVKAALGQLGLDESFYEGNRSALGFNVGVQMGGALSLFQLGVGDFKAKMANGKRVVDPDASFKFAGFSGDVNAAATLGFGVEDRPLANQVALSTQLAFTAEAKLGFTWDFLDQLLNDPFKKAQKSIDDSPDSDLMKYVKGKALEEAKSRIFKVLNLDEKISPEALQWKKSLEAEYEIGVVLDKTQNLRPTELDVTFKGAKPFGVTQSSPGGSRYALTYKVETQEGITNVLQNLEGISRLFGTDVPVQHAGTVPFVPVGPTNLSEAFFNFVRLILEQGKYEQTVEAGQTLQLPIGLGAEILAEGAGASIVLDGYHSNSFPIEKGALVNGVQAKLESYEKVTPPTIMESFIASLKTWLKTKTDPYKEILAKQANKVTSLWKIIVDKATLILSPQAPEYQSANMITYQFTGVTGPLASVARDPSDVAGSAGKPHYGVGGFYTLTPIDTVLSQPAQFVLAYADSDVDGIDENTLALYRWNQTAGDWDPVTAVIDTATNTVTATITAFGTYALAPPMPAGQIAWATTVVEDAGTTDAPTTRVTVVSDPLRRNDGTTVPAGTVVHIIDVLPEGVVLTPDAQSEVDGLQIVTDAAGRLHLQVELVGRPAALSIDAFSDHGTISGRVVVPIQR
ncbi:MAG TPA: Ig-like domain-containing protein [Propionicimonas sp.]